MPTHSCTISVNAPVSAVYETWAELEDYPRFLSHVEKVECIDEGRSRWKVNVMGGHEWEAVNEDWIEGRQIGWRSTSGSENRGRITFEADPAHPDTTLLTVELTVNPPAGTVHDAGAAAAGEAAFEAQLRDDLEGYAEMVEALAMARRDRRAPGIERGTDRSEEDSLRPAP